jgi:hypothetical protein
VKTYLIGYDLNKSGKNYDGLIDKIKEIPTLWWHHLDSTWIIKTDQSAVQVRDQLKPYLDSDDELLVVRLTGEGAWTGFNERGSKWLKDNLSLE